MNYWDRLYNIRISPEDLEHYKISEFARLNRVSHSAIPTCTQPIGVCASKGEHSRGVRHLGKITANKPEFRKYAANIIAACTWHDAATPPFSHLSEHMQVEMTGKNHEQAVDGLITKEHISYIIRKYGADPYTVIRYINGTDKPMSDLINGTIDLDNLDTTLRFGLSTGVIRKKMYDPELLARSFTLMEDGTIALNVSAREHVALWEQCREKVYQYVYGNENLCSAAMFLRALAFAYINNELPLEYFSYTDDQALEFLLHRTNGKTRFLVNAAVHWNFYTLVADYSFTLDRIPGGLQTICSNWRGRQYLADRLSEELKFNPEQVCVFAGHDKGVKHIHVPFIGNRKEDKSIHIQKRPKRVVCKVFIHPDTPVKQHVVEKLCETAFTENITLPI